MKQRLTPEQRTLINQLLDNGEDRHTIANLASVTAGQVSAVAAHRTMAKHNRTRTSYGAARASEEVLTESDEGMSDSCGYSSPDSAAIPLGTDIEARQPVIWDPYTSSNPHVLILGESGSGKTYTASRLVIELARAQLPSIVFDYGQGFSLQHAPRAFREDVHTIELQLGRDGIAINPLQVFPVDTHGPATVAQRVADTFVRVYPRLGVQQHALIRRAVLELLSEAGISTDDPRTWILKPPPFRDLEQKLTEYASHNEVVTRRAASSAGPHVSTLFFFNTFRKTGRDLNWSKLVAHRNEVWILQLGGLEASVERAVTEFLLWSLIRYFEALGPGPLRCFVVLDEAHKLAFGQGSPVEKILREGRKFGLGVILASQQPEDFSPVAFANTATKIAFQIADHSGHISRQLHRKIKNGHSYEHIAESLGTLPRGSAYIVMANTGHVTKMLSFEEEQARRPHKSRSTAHKDTK